MTRTHYDIWRELWLIGAPDNSIARICETHQTRVRKWRIGQKLPVVPRRVGYRDIWEDHHQAEIAEIMGKQ